MDGEQCIVCYKYDGINCFNSDGGSITVIYRAISSGCFELCRVNRIMTGTISARACATFRYRRQPIRLMTRPASIFLSDFEP